MIKASLDCASVGLFNVALTKNSVGFFQLAKLSCVPCTVLFQFLLLRETISWATASALVPLCLGIGIATVTDMQATFEGAMWATAAVVATVMSHVLTKLMAHATGGPLQLLNHAAPFAALIMVTVSVVTGDHPRIESVLPDAMLSRLATPSVLVPARHPHLVCLRPRRQHNQLSSPLHDLCAHLPGSGAPQNRLDTYNRLRVFQGAHHS